MTTELALRTDASTLMASAESAIMRLEELDSARDLRNVRTWADAAQAVGNALQSFELANAAAELRVRAERRAGQLRVALREDGALQALDGTPGKLRTLYDFDVELGVSGETAAKWERLSLPPQKVVDAVIADLKDRRVELTTHKVLTAATEQSAECLERGIYRLPSGILQIRWRQRGKRCSMSLQGVTSVATARQRLLERRGRHLAQVRERPSRVSLDWSYSDLRVLLDRLDKVLPSLDATSSKHVRAAMGALHRAEDELTKALMADELSHPKVDAA